MTVIPTAMISITQYQSIIVRQASSPVIKPVNTCVLWTITVAGDSANVRIFTLKAEHYSDAIISAIASQITGVSIVCSTVHSGAHQRKHQSSASLAFVRGIHRWPVDSPHKGPVTRKIFPFDDVTIKWSTCMKAADIHLVLVNHELSLSVLWLTTHHKLDIILDLRRVLWTLGYLFPIHKDIKLCAIILHL